MNEPTPCKSCGALMDDEEWRPVVGFERYEVSSHGRVRHGRLVLRTHRQKIRNAPGYFMISLRRDGRQTVGLLVHRLVMFAFAGPPLPGQEVNHKNGDKSVNCLSNLEWVTRSENRKHAFALGLSKPNAFVMLGHRGEENAFHKLTESEVRQIKALKGSISSIRLAPRYGVSHALIRDIWLGRRWAHVS